MNEEIEALKSGIKTCDNIINNKISTEETKQIFGEQKIKLEQLLEKKLGKPTNSCLPLQK